ncbi:TasA family protein [uncultured Ruthenibacterium sp.]|mgnify:CR=1 FL=1|uniref:TasA family protein n=1 Tax=uncultured Ruthenibacterium sp. TaxID=1905347 RepID=UPI00349E9E8F
MKEQGNARRKLILSVIAVIALAVCLGITTLALVYPRTSVDDNAFTLGTVQLNLNDNVPIIQADERLFEPGMTVEKNFFVQNEGSVDVYCRMYFENVTGGLEDILEITIKDVTNPNSIVTLYQGTPANLNKAGAIELAQPLAGNSRSEFTITFHYPEQEGNAGKNQTLAFDLTVDAVQAKNNPGRAFD